ncbi:hypothetical protein EON65_55080 [archaeon]|nr:MAG: hypothetical protein EON65_55080 [archaeon]
MIRSFSTSFFTNSPSSLIAYLSSSKASFPCLLKTMDDLDAELILGAESNTYGLLNASNYQSQ